MTKAATLTNPYVGPRTFTSAERGLFFGRDAEARELLSLVVSQRLVLFYAQSGAGKSSLLNARLVPDLAEQGFTVLPIARVGAEIPRGIEQVDNVFLFSLMLSLDQGGGDPARLAHLSLADFLTCLTSDDGEQYYYADSHDGAAEANRVLESAPPTGPQPVADQYAEPNFVLIIDQFEEIFTTHLQRWEDRAAFFEQLEQAMKHDPKMWVVLALREDYVAALDPYAHQLADKLRARYYMQRMGKEAALQAVQNPARLAGRPFDTGVAGQLVDNLSQIQILGEAASWPGQYVEPVQLQVVCYQLWENLKNDLPGLITSANLAAYGNVDNALADFYNRTIKEVVGLPDVQVSELQLRLWFSKQLITEAGTRSIIDQGKETTRGMPNHVVRALADRYLLRAEPRAGAIWIELVHDRFVAPIRRANRDAEAEQKQFEAAENARQEAEKQRVEAEVKASHRLRRLAVALVVVSLIAMVAAILAVFGWNQAESAKVSLVERMDQAAQVCQQQAAEAQAISTVASLRAANLQATADAGVHLPPETVTAQAEAVRTAVAQAAAAQATAQVSSVQAANLQATADALQATTNAGPQILPATATAQALAAQTAVAQAVVQTAAASATAQSATAQALAVQTATAQAKAKSAAALTTAQAATAQACPLVTGPFAAVWAKVQGTVGCATRDAFSLNDNGAVEKFDRGLMFWRSDSIDKGQALVVFNPNSWQIVQYASYDAKVDPLFSCQAPDTPPDQCPPTPNGGFGKMWCDPTTHIQQRLGNATTCAELYKGPMQNFERGFMLQYDAEYYVFYDNGRWEKR